MSTVLPIIDLSGAVVGSTGFIDLKPAGYTSDPGFTNNKATLQIQNESGSGLTITTFKGQESTYLAAGGWKNLLLTPGESKVQWTVIYQLPNPGVTVLLSEFYRPGETVIPPGTLGNSPVSVSQGVNVVTATNLINTGNPPGTNIINAIVSGDAQAAVALTNDGILALGDAAHGGGLSVVGPSTFTGQIQGDATNKLTLDGKAQSIVFAESGVQEMFVDTNGLTINNRLNFAGAARVLSPIKALTGFHLDLDTSRTVDFVRLLNNGALQAQATANGLQLNNGTLSFLVGSISKINFGLTSVTTGGTAISHGLGATPSFIVVQVTVNSSAFVSGIGATTFQCTPTVNQNVFWLAMIA